VTRWCAAYGLSPNQVTTVSFLLVIAATALFWLGHFVLGLAAAWVMTFLDTVDGKLARVTLSTSKLGHVFDHGMDLLHPPVWWFAWWRGLERSGFTNAPLLFDALVVVIAGYVVGRVLEGVFIVLFEFESYAWRPVDSLFRQIVARRNPNLLLLTISVVLGRSDLGFLAVAGWTLASLLFQGMRLMQALLDRSAGRPPQSWLATGTGADSAIARYAA
jgi:phosphatidylglycerophosphate synthase